MARRSGYLFALASAATAGSVATLGKIALREVDPLMLTAIIDLAAAAMIFPASPRLSLRRADWHLVLAITLLGGFASPTLFYIGLGLTTATNAALLVNTEVLFTILIAMGALRERGNHQEYLAVVLLGAGAIVVTTNLRASLPDLLATLGGNLLLILAYLGWGFDNNFSRILSERSDTFQLVWVKYVVGGSLLLGLAILVGLRPPGRLEVYPTLLALSLCYGVATWTFYAALQRIGAMRSIALFSTVALFGVLVASVVLHEVLGPVQLLGGVVMGSGVVLIAMNERSRKAEVAGRGPPEGVPVEYRRD